MIASLFVRSGTAAALSTTLSLLAPGQGGPLPPPPVPPQNPVTASKAILGKILFWEEQMSSNHRVACGTCHMPEAGGGDLRRLVHPGADGVFQTPDDVFGSPGIHRADVDDRYLPDPLFGFREQATGRASPSNLTAAWFPELFWDGRAPGQFTDPLSGAVRIPVGGALESQAVEPPLAASEMAHDLRTWGDVTGRLAAARPMALCTNLPPDIAAAVAGGTGYPALFAAAFGDPAITPERIAFALATYQRTLVPDQTPWDQFQRGVPGALTPGQVAGMNLFNGRARCNLCHQPGLFSDRTFRNLGLRPIPQDPGRQNVTSNPADRGRFKVPSLRNSGLRRSYMHTGQFTDLNQVLAFYRGGGGPNLNNKDPQLLPLQLNPQESAQVIDFVANALTDPRVRNRQFPFDRPTLLSERQPPRGNLLGLGSPGTGGAVPQQLADVPANLGNPGFKLGLWNGRGGAAATLAVALSAAPPGSQILGLPIHVDVWVAPALIGTVLAGPAGVAGAGFTTLQQPVPAAPVLAGLDLFTQWFVWDPAPVAGAAVTAGARIPIF